MDLEDLRLEDCLIVDLDKDELRGHLDLPPLPEPEGSALRKSVRYTLQRPLYVF